MAKELNMPVSIKRFRQENNVSIKSMSAVLGIDSAGYSLESTKRGNNPTIKTLYKIASAYNVSLDYLAGLTDDPRPVNQILDDMASKPPKSEMTQAELQAELNKIKARLDALEQK